MKSFMKYSASAVALVAAISLSQAQTNERTPGTEHEQGKPSQGKGNEHAPTPSRGQNEQKQQGSERESKGQHAGKPEDNAQRGERDEAKGKHTQVSGSSKSETTATKQEGGRTRVSIDVTPEKKTRLHNFIARDSSIRRYQRSDIHFSLNVGTRIPEAMEFYDAPSQILDIDPDFRSYKIIVLDDVILIVDPETREIVAVIDV